jgi:DNA-binding XRE family transcriptional regulator
MQASKRVSPITRDAAVHERVTTTGCHTRIVTHKIASNDRDTFGRLKEVRAEAIEHTKQARRLAMERREIMLGLIEAGYSQADIARELGVTRQAVQKWLSF